MEAALRAGTRAKSRATATMRAETIMRMRGSAETPKSWERMSRLKA